MSGPQLKADDKSSFYLWGGDIQLRLAAFELLSHVAFTRKITPDPTPNDPNTEDDITGCLWHCELAPQGDGLDPPTADYKPIAKLSRPPRAIFEAQLAIIEQYADLRPDRLGEILIQTGVLHAFFGSIAFMDPGRSPYTVAVINAALELAQFAEQRFKHALSCKRPNEYSPQIQPVIATPLHGALPSGHSTEAHIIATVMASLLNASGNPAYMEPIWRSQLFRQAARIAINRTVAGVHFPADSAAGACLGMTLGGYFVARASGGTGYQAWRFTGSSFGGDFSPDDMYDPDANVQTAVAATNNFDTPTIAATQPDSILRCLWDEAVQEWA